MITKEFLFPMFRMFCINMCLPFLNPWTFVLTMWTPIGRRNRSLVHIVHKMDIRWRFVLNSVLFTFLALQKGLNHQEYVAGCVIQAAGMVEFENGLRTGVILHCRCVLVLGASWLS